jgi:hypothetical protein
MTRRTRKAPFEEKEITDVFSKRIMTESYGTRGIPLIGGAIQQRESIPGPLGDQDVGVDDPNDNIDGGKIRNRGKNAFEMTRPSGIFT